MASMTFYVERDDLEETELDVNYTFSKGYRGKRDSYGVPLEPDELDHVEIESVVVAATGAPFTLTPDEQDRLDERIREYVHESSLPDDRDDDDDRD